MNCIAIEIQHKVCELYGSENDITSQTCTEGIDFRYSNQTSKGGSAETPVVENLSEMPHVSRLRSHSI